MDFSSLGLIAPILEAVADEGYERPTPIQQRAIPHVLTGGDLLGLGRERSRGMVGIVGGVVQGNGCLEDVLVEVARVVLAARLKWPDHLR